ncbi:LysM peptidoglycan-binding domain-containing M23 family metallopeptidase [Microbaculum marinum]|uniref:LysM peptidoglycan-binding domain-containing M23 family metallopeptidase n=1 Tax=Microbaculum marinum TaxID=1764581 RepID=A0AAW9RZJ1_9HYPH
MAAGCSSDTSRFAGSFFGGADPEYTGSVPPTPTQPVTSAALGDPRAQSAYNQLGSVPSGSGNGTTVIVGPGETVYSISQRYGVPANALMSVNGLGSASAVQPGQTLIIPVFSQAQNGWVRPDPASTGVKVAGPAPISAAPVAAASGSSSASVPAGGAMHTVTSGQTVYSLGRMYGVSPNAIIEANNLQAPYGVRIGQKVRIPGATTAKSASSTVQQAANNEAATTSAGSEANDAAATGSGDVQSAELPAPEKVAYAPQNDADAGTDTRAEIPQPAALSAGNFRWPVRGRVISSYGEKNDGGTNDGINVSVPEGTSVRASENGVVAYAGNELKGYGNLVLIRHSDDWVTAYAHNSELLVKRGDVVSRGQVIAKAGQTGSVSTPQMHFELRKGSQPVDPLKYLAAE